MAGENDTIVGLGARGDYVAPVPSVDPVRLRLTSDETRLLAGIGRVARIADVLSRSGMDEPRAIALLLALRAKGAIAPAKYQPPPPKTTIDAAMAEEVDLPADRKKEILDLDRSLESLNHFEVFGLQPGAPIEVVKQAYYDASRRYHPDRYYGKNLGSFRGRLDRIFRRLSEAEKVLTDPVKREGYLKANPELAAFTPASSSSGGFEAESIRTAEGEQREAERRARFAKHPYLMKSTRVNELVQRAKHQLESGEAALAIADLTAALQIDPKHKEALALQGEARRAHESHRAANELKRAAELEASGDENGACGAYKIAAALDPRNAAAAFKAAILMIRLGQDAKEVRVFAQRAVELEPRNADHHFLLAKVLEDAGLKKLAEKHIDEGLKLNPNHAEAKKRARKFPWPF